jgi:hypothetical protein
LALRRLPQRTLLWQVVLGVAVKLVEVVEPVDI